MFIRNRVISLFGVILFGAALVVSANAYSPAPAPPVYSAVGDFPTVVTGVTSATNLPWSYGYASTLNPVNFTPDTNATSDYFGDGNAAGFYTPTLAGYVLPTVLKNITGNIIPVEAGTIGPWSPNLLLLHPGPTGDYSVVRFTAATTATYVVTGEFIEIGDNITNPSPAGVTDDSVNITTSGPNSTTIKSTTSSSTPYYFSFDQALAAGQSLDFAVGLGPQGQFSYDSTGFNATISATPEPGFYGVLALGLSGLILVLSRRRDLVSDRN